MKRGVSCPGGLVVDSLHDRDRVVLLYILQRP